jgi:hypothetical protein
VKYHSKTLEDGTDGVRGGLRIGNQIVEKKAHDQEDDEPLDPRHVGLLILPVFTADYSNTVLRVQVEASTARVTSHRALRMDHPDTNHQS